MTDRLFLDLDGTLVDSRERQYRLFMELAPGCGLSFDAYWTHKRANVNQGELLRRHADFTAEQARAFKAAWLTRIEEPARLELDTVLPGVPAFLERARQSHALYVVTGRQDHDRLLAQLRRLGLFEFFTDILNTGQRCSKAELIRARASWQASDLMVGDTGEDIDAGRALGMRTAAVLSGALSRAVLERHAPDWMLADVTELGDAILAAATIPAIPAPQGAVAEAHGR